MGDTRSRLRPLDAAARAQDWVLNMYLGATARLRQAEQRTSHVRLKAADSAGEGLYVRGALARNECP
jgi:hypothetical protein